MNFSLNLKNLREEKGLSQAQLAKQLHVGTGSVGMWESTDRIPPVKKLVKIADFFNVSLDVLLGRNNNFILQSTPILPQEESNLLSLFHKMTHAQKVRFMAYGEGMVGIDVPKFNA